MPKVTVACPECGHHLAIESGSIGDHANCPKCHRLFTIDHRTGGGVSELSGRLSVFMDSSPASTLLDPYRILAGHQITPDSPLGVIQKVFPDTPAEDKAQRALANREQRLTVDLFLYPDWEAEE